MGQAVNRRRQEALTTNEARRQQGQNNFFAETAEIRGDPTSRLAMLRMNPMFRQRVIASNRL